MRRVLSVLAAIVAVAVLAVPAFAAGWTAPSRIDPLRVSRSPDGPSIAVHDNRLYVAVASDGILMLTSRSGTWERTRITTDHNFDGHRRVDDEPSLVVDAKGKVHIAFARLTTTSSDCSGMGCGHTALMYATNRRGSWVVTKVHSGDDSFPSIALTSTGHARIAFMRGARILLATRASGEWSTVQVAGNATTDLPRPGAPRLAIRGTKVFIVYGRDANDTATIRLVEITANTTTRTTVGQGVNPDIALGTRGRPHVAFYGGPNDALTYATRHDHGAWTIERIASDVANEYRPSIAMVGGGHVAIVALRLDRPKPTNGSGDIILRTNRTGTWTGQRLTHVDTERFPADRLPQIAVNTDGKARVVFLRETGPASAPIDTIWMTREL